MLVKDVRAIGAVPLAASADSHGAVQIPKEDKTPTPKLLPRQGNSLH